MNVLAWKTVELRGIIKRKYVIIKTIKYREKSAFFGLYAAISSSTFAKNTKLKRKKRQNQTIYMFFSLILLDIN